jgi:glycosyltransferase involved in cell wall biosynthesis
MKLMKVLANFGVGGTERQVINLSLALDPARVAVHFACLRLWGEFLDEIRPRNFPVFDYGVNTFKHPRIIAAQLRLARDIRQLGIQIVHTYNFYANVFAIPAAKLAGARVVASIRVPGTHYFTPNQIRVERYACKLADHILVNAGAIRDWLVDERYDDGRRISVIPNGINLARFNGSTNSGILHREFNLPADAPLVGVVGRVKPQKGIEDFLRAASIAAVRFPAARFLIIGGSKAAFMNDDAYLAELARLVERLGLGGRVIFTGFRDDVERILPELSVCVQPSHTEGLSNALLEAMTAGVPTVATRVGDSAEAVRDGETGLLVPASDPPALAAAIKQLLADSTLAARLGQSGRNHVTNRYSMSRLVDDTSALYESLLAS